MHEGDIMEEVIFRLSRHDTLRLSTPSLHPNYPPTSTWWCCCCYCFRSLQTSKYANSIPPTPTIRSEAQADVADFVEEPWYHGDISWKVAEERLNVLGSDCYLVRKSQSEEGKYILSVRYGGVIKHHPICVQDQRYEVEKTKKQFRSLQQLVAYYKKHPFSTEWEMLTIPCSPPRLTQSEERPPPTILIQGMSCAPIKICV